MQTDNPKHRFVTAGRLRNLTALVMLCGTAFCGAARVADDDWSTDWGKTFAAAREDNARPILIKYEASWCGPCKMLTEEMQRAGVKAVLGDFHLLRIDVDQPPEGANVEGINSLPTMRVVSANEEIISQQIGMIQGESLMKWLTQCDSAYKEIVRRRNFAKQLSSGVLDDEQIDLLLAMLQDRSASQRSAATELLVQYPQLAASQVIGLLSAAKMRARVAALDVLRRWPAPIEGIDPWEPDTITTERVAALDTWAKSVASDDLASEVDPKLLVKASDDAIAEAELEIDRLLRRGPIREGLVDGLAVVGPELVTSVETRLGREISDTARERLSAVHYRLVASPTLSIRLPGVTDKLASIDSSSRRVAAQQLSEQAQKDDVQLLETLFAHNDPLVRELALRGLQRSGGGEASELVKFLKDPDKNVRAAVLKLWLDSPKGYLAKSISEHAIQETDSGLLVYYVRLMKEIGHDNGEIHDSLASLAEHDDWQVRAEVAETIAHFAESISDSSNPILPLALQDCGRTLLNDSDAFVLSKIVPAIIDVDQEANFDRLLDVALEYPEIRNAVLPALDRSLHDEDNTKYLVEKFASGESDARGFALEAMSRLGVTDHETYIRKGFDDDSPDVQLAAVRALSAWLDDYRQNLAVLPTPAADAAVGDVFGFGVEASVSVEPVFHDGTDHATGLLQTLGAFFGGGQAKPEVIAPVTIESPEAAVKEATEVGDAAALVDDGADTETPIEKDPVEEGDDTSDSRPVEESPAVNGYESWLAEWQASPESVLPWLEGVRQVVEGLMKSSDAPTKAHAVMAAVRMGIVTDPKLAIEEVSSLPDSDSRLQATYPWLQKEDRRGLLYAAAESEHVADYFPELVEVARQYDKDTIQRNAWKALERVDPQHVEYGYSIHRVLMQVVTGQRYFDSSSPKATAKFADKLAKTFASLESPLARLFCVSLMGDVDSSRVNDLVGTAYDNRELDDATRRDWARMGLGGKPTTEATTLAVQWLEDETFRKVALDYIAEGHDGISVTELASMEVPRSDFGNYSSGKIIVANINPAVQPSMIAPLLEHEDPEIVAKATFVLIALGEDVDITPLAKIAREKGGDGYLHEWTNMYVLAIAARNDDADVSFLEKFYRGMASEYQYSEFYWKIRIMTGPRALKLRKTIRDEVGVQELM